MRVGCDIAVSGDTGAPTVRACATNPFTAGCDTGDLAELFDIADQKVEYCAEGAPTIFSAECNTRDEVNADRDALVRTCLADSTDSDCTDTILVEGVTGVDEVNLADCVENPWLPACTSISLFDNARFAHTEFCMRGGRADDPECMTLLENLRAVGSTTAQKTRATCITNPFAAACSSTTLGTTYDSARANRYAFCRDTAVIADAGTDGLCAGDGETTGTTIVSEICSWNGTDSTTTGTGTRINPLAGVCDVSYQYR